MKLGYFSSIIVFLSILYSCSNSGTTTVPKKHTKSAKKMYKYAVKTMKAGDDESARHMLKKLKK